MDEDDLGGGNSEGVWHPENESGEAVAGVWCAESPWILGRE